jgi:hypothetical protein
MPVTDQVGAIAENAVSAPGTAKLGTWTQLIGVFLAEQQTLFLYVDGVLAGQASAGQWAGGPPAGFVRIGNLTPGGSKHDWNGRISDVCLIFNAAQGPDVSLLYRGDSRHPHDGCAAMYAKYP